MPSTSPQEGHRLEPRGENLEGGAENWERKGVVYNEMKGAMNSTSRQVYHAFSRSLLSDTEYRFNSGGEPLAIPSLTHEQLVAFHRRSYCPANACFVTYGNMEESYLHEQFAPYLSGDTGTTVSPPPLQSTFATPKDVDVNVPQEQGQDPLDVTSVSLGWLWEETNIDAWLLGALIDGLLVGHAGSPLRLALEKSGLGRSLGSAGYLGAMRNGLFLLEMRGVPEADYEKFEPLVRDALASVVEKGFSDEEIEAALHQLELARRMIGGDGIPFGLQLCDRVADAWKVNQPPLPVLDPAQGLSDLKTRARTPGFLKEAIRERLLDNQSRVLIRARPDTEFGKKLLKSEEEQVTEELASLDLNARQSLKQQAEELHRRQTTEADNSCPSGIAPG